MVTTGILGLIKSYKILSKSKKPKPPLSLEERAVLSTMYERGVVYLHNIYKCLNLNRRTILLNLKFLQQREFVFIMVDPASKDYIYGITEKGRTEVEMFHGK